MKKIYLVLIVLGFCSPLLSQGAYTDLNSDYSQLQYSSVTVQAHWKGATLMENNNFITMPWSMGKKGKVCFYGGLSVMAIGGYIWFYQSDKTYNQYLDIKNDVLYQSNNFTQQDLEQIDKKRKEKLDKANKEKLLGIGLLSIGSLSFIYSLATEPEDHTPQF